MAAVYWHSSKSHRVAVPDVSSEFHVYGVLWNERFIAWYFDGRLVGVHSTPADLNQPVYMVVNLTVGGTVAGAPNEFTRFPALMEVDYIIVKKEGDSP